jgi:hypothetical protein
LAIYHCSIKIIARGEGKSAVAAAAYRSGETLINEYDGVTHDYTRKGGIVHTEILLPEHAPRDYADRSILWNAVEKCEKSARAQLSREVEVALPVELTREQSISLLRGYVQENFVNAGMCADVCAHDKGGGNPHAHIMLTMRPIEQDGTWGAKQKKEYILDQNGDKVYDKSKKQYQCRAVQTTDWNDRGKAEVWRAAWADSVNTALEQQGMAERVDHRSYERQGVELVPTVHLGVAAMQMERRGVRTERGDMNRAVINTNRELFRLRARIVKLQTWVSEEAANPAPPMLSDVITEILYRQGQSGVSRLKEASQTLLFLQRNEIYDMADLEKKVSAMYGKGQVIREKMKPLERRIKTLEEHLQQSEIFKTHRKVKAKYDELYSLYESARKETGVFAEHRAKKALADANAYYDVNSAGIILCQTAERYLKDVLQERFDPKKLPPITKWREELSAKTTERAALNREYLALKDETRKVEQIRRSVGEIMRSEAWGRETVRGRGVGM